MLTLVGNNLISKANFTWMLFKSFLITAYFISLFYKQTNAQDCTVSISSLSGKYEGECKKGKADGMGKATGEDYYDGKFKSGYPDGRGKYVWKNGNWYDGEWSKGLKNGTGTMEYKLFKADSSFKDSTVTGFWKKDKYIGLYEKPYTLVKKTVHITDVACQRMNDTRNQVELFLNSETGNLNTSFGGGQVARPEITDIQIVTGTYMRKTVNDNYGKKIGYLFEEVTFPFRAIYSINYGKDMFELDISEAGKWTVEVRTSY